MARILQISFIDPYSPQASGASVSLLRETAFLQKRHHVDTIVVDWRDRLHTQQIDGIRTFFRGKRVSLRTPFPCSSRVNAATTQAVAEAMRTCDYVLVQGLQSYQLFVAGAARAGGLGDRKSAIVFHDIESEYFRNAARYTKPLPAKLYYLFNGWQFSALERQIVSQMRNLFFVTEEDKQSARSLVDDGIARNMAVLKIPPGELSWSPPHNTVTTVGYFGDCTLAMNLVPLVEELSQLGDLPIRILIAGQGSDRIERLPANTQALGYVENLNAFLNRCDVLWFPIRHEGGVKIKILDAVGSGAPVITTRLGLKGFPQQGCDNVFIYRNMAELRQMITDWKGGTFAATVRPTADDIACLDPLNWI